ncbi:hypothetical protein FDP41_005620 [Naegleria fowleri]|uniref:SMP-30/Gluconolactonase/LRE-like region domain-containing protein n=1 Tax=Naegleria fowleri TaxID=5763 RepID=A0A6A5BL59_NAEFO|nr:uncharacterized protein FDP41_005620 [Naegleria fowleri]KAF0975626.1 hypothetical protein FDP41_005620 [Naegleria fowleri]
MFIHHRDDDQNSTNHKMHQGGSQDSLIVVVASGFTWAENLAISEVNGIAFMSDIYGEKLWRIYYNESSERFEQHVFLDVETSPFNHYFGLALYETAKNSSKSGNFENGNSELPFPDGSVLYVVVRNHADGESYVISMDPNIPFKYQVVSRLPKVGNGLALHKKTHLLYVTTEGGFLPYGGQVYQVNPRTRSCTTILTDLYAADGAFIDQERNWLYVSQVIGSKVLVIDLEKLETLKIANSDNFKREDIVIREFIAPCEMLDDFTLSRDGKILYGADFWGGKVVKFSAWDGSNSSVIASDLIFPTSVRLGPRNLRPHSSSQIEDGETISSLFVTEGGGLFPSMVKNRKLLEILNN